MWWKVCQFKEELRSKDVRQVTSQCREIIRKVLMYSKVSSKYYVVVTDLDPFQMEPTWMTVTLQRLWQVSCCLEKKKQRLSISCFMITLNLKNNILWCGYVIFFFFFFNYLIYSTLSACDINKVAVINFAGKCQEVECLLIIHPSAELE